MASRSPEHFDPRIGDEGDEDLDQHLSSPSSQNSRPSHAPQERHVRLNLPPVEPATAPAYGEKDLERGDRNPIVDAEKSDGTNDDGKSRAERWGKHALRNVLVVGEKVSARMPFTVDLSWVSNNLTWAKFKPVIRVAVVAWICLLFVIIPKTEILLGNGSFLILIATVLMPPSQPFIAIVEQEVTLMFFATVAWAWACLGLFLANLARTEENPSAPLSEITTGRFIEAGPSVIHSVFLFFGSTFFLYLKARYVGTPFLIPAILACVCLDVMLCTAGLFPYAFYNIGKNVVVPLGFHSALSIFFSATLFPSTVTAQYAASIKAVLEPLDTFLAQHRKTLKLDPSSPEFAASVITLRGFVNKSEGGLTAAAVWYRLLQRDVLYGRFAPGDVGSLQWWIRRIVTRCEGMNIYFTLIEPTREKFPVTPAATVPPTPRASSPTGSSRISMVNFDSGPTSPVGEVTGGPQDPAPLRRRRDIPDEDQKKASGDHSPLHSTFTRHIREAFNHGAKHKPTPEHDDHMHFSLLQLAHVLAFPSFASFDHHRSTEGRAAESAVGVFESQRYLALESTRLTYRSPELTGHFTQLLSEACDELLEGCRSGLSHMQQWTAGVRSGNWENRGKTEARRKERLKSLEDVKRSLDADIERFRKSTRHRVLDPYRVAFDPKHLRESDGALEAPPHKYLFHCYMYEYHALQLAILTTGLLGEVIRLEQARKHAKLWIPSFSNTVLFWSDRFNGTQDMDRDDDEDPDVIPLMDSRDDVTDPDLGQTGRRDPDALPPSNTFEVIMYWMYAAFAALGGGNVLFAIKAGILTILLSLPYHFKSSAQFAYQQHLTWAIFIGQLTISRFRGDTTFGLVARIIATFFGGLLGTVLWYASTGSGRGSHWGLAIVGAVSFPFIFYARLYWPAPPILNMIFFVTALVIVGFSWQDTHFPAGFVYFGIAVSWRRFVLVSAGVTAAFLFSFLPPSTTLRGYQRRMMATTVAEIGSVYCSVVSFANTRGTFETERGEIVQSLIAIRLKLKRSLVLRANIVYEFSLRGRWPSERYQKILEVQLEIAYLLSHLMSVVEHLEPAWRRAFLRRTRFLDADFQGDVLAVISMLSTSLRTGHPLPQITPCPLLDRYMQNQHGLNILRQEADDDYGLPRTMTIDTLADEQYLCFSVGCTTAFGIMLRLDRLMLATKELVGEQYHIHGVGLSSYGESSNTKVD